jgi:hypothetical protein
MKDWKLVQGWETHAHPEADKANLWVDCPLCGGEHCYIVFRQNKRAIVRCERGSIEDVFVVDVLNSSNALCLG